MSFWFYIAIMLYILGGSLFVTVVRKYVTEVIFDLIFCFIFWPITLLSYYICRFLFGDIDEV